MPLYFGDGTFSNISITGNTDGMATPSNHNLAAWAYDPLMGVANLNLTNGQPRAAAIYVAKSVSITKIYWWVSTVGVTPTAGQNHVGIYDSAGNKLASVGVDADYGTTGLKTATISSTALTAGQFYWCAIVANAATPPGVAANTSVIGAAAPINVGLPASAMRFGVLGGLSTQTTLPATITPANNAISSGAWFAVA
jgi:hypothetical protein